MYHRFDTETANCIFCQKNARAVGKDEVCPIRQQITKHKMTPLTETESCMIRLAIAGELGKWQEMLQDRVPSSWQYAEKRVEALQQLLDRMYAGDLHIEERV